MKHILIWIKWKLFVSIDEPTCFFIKKHGFWILCCYKSFLVKNKHDHFLSLRYCYPSRYKQLRREMMYRFLVKGEM